MGEHRKFLCDIYQDDELLYENVETNVFVGHIFISGDPGSSKKIRFQEAAKQAVEGKYLGIIECQNYGDSEKFKVIVTEASTDERRIIFVEAEITLNYNVSGEQEIAALERYES